MRKYSNDEIGFKETIGYKMRDFNYHTLRRIEKKHA